MKESKKNTKSNKSVLEENDLKLLDQELKDLISTNESLKIGISKIYQAIDTNQTNQK